MSFKDERISVFRLGAGLCLGVLLSGCGAHVFHQVRKDETLYSISWRYHQDYQQVAKWNDLKPPYIIAEGQWLRVAPPGPDAGLEAPVYSSAKRKQQAKATAAKKSETTPAPKATTAKPQQAPQQAKPSSAPAAASSPRPNWRWPVKGEVLQTFADKPGRQGIDIAGRAGTIVNASASGKVVYSGNGLRGYGNLIIIKHSEKYLSAYAHNQSILVKEGVQVKQGEAIARMGNTESSRVKLHFQIRINGKPVDPLRYLPK